MSQKFLENGYKVVNFEEYADIYIINTCTVTNMADRKSRQMIRRVKEINPNSIVVACGCYAQANKEELEKVEEIDIILGTNQKNNVVDSVEKYMETHTKNAIISDVMQEREFVDFGTTTYTEKTRAVIKIQDGCDRFCSYCIIPYARGRVRSRKLENIIEEVKQIVADGIKEVVITGIHVASYGKDFNDGKGLIDLLEEMNKIENLERIRLSSLEPTLITEEFMKRLTKLNKVCHHFHLSLQSGCTETLKRMNRRYTTEQFEKIVELLRSAYKEKSEDVMLTTDIIVGFPGETEEEFNETYEYLKRIKFYKMHVFKYSQRKGTKAAVMPNQVSNNIKEERSKKLIQLSNQNEIEYNKKYIGREVKVLFEERKGNYIKGHTENYLMVGVATDKNMENKVCNVKIIDINGNELLGEIV